MAILLPSSKCHHARLTRYPRSRSKASCGSDTITKHQDLPPPTTSKIEGYEVSNVPSILIYLGLVRPPDLIDVTENETNTDTDSNAGVYAFERGSFNFHIRPSYNSLGRMRPPQIKWDQAQSFIDLLKVSEDRPGQTWLRQGATPGDSIITILEEYLELDQKKTSERYLSWAKDKRSEAGLTDEDFTFKVVYTLAGYEDPAPTTRIPEEFRPLDMERYWSQLERFRGFTLGDFHRPFGSSRAPKGSVLWPVIRPNTFEEEESELQAQGARQSMIGRWCTML